MLEDAGKFCDSYCFIYFLFFYKSLQVQWLNSLGVKRNVNLTAFFVEYLKSKYSLCCYYFSACKNACHRHLLRVIYFISRYS